MILAGDVGGTKTNLALLHPAGRGLRLAAYGLANVRGVLAQDFGTMLGVMIQMELPVFSRFRPGVVFLHAQMTDLMLACGNPAALRAFTRLAKESQAEPGLMTRNGPWLRARLSAWGLEALVLTVPPGHDRQSTIQAVWPAQGVQET